MNRIKTRRAAKKEAFKNKIFAYCFMILALFVGEIEFLLWYFVGIPTWLFAASECACAALMVCGCGLYDAAENAAELWNKFDI